MKMTKKKQKEMLAIITELFTSGKIAECHITTNILEKHEKETGNISVIKRGFIIDCDYATNKK